MTFRFAPFVTALLALIFSSRAHAALGETVVRAVPPANLKSRFIKDWGYIDISGDIRQSAVSRLSDVVEQTRRSVTSQTLAGDPILRMFVDSCGGEVAAAIKMGDIIRANAIEVYVDNKAECSSACIFLLAAGVSRNAFDGARLGIHRPFFPAEAFAGLSFAQSQQQYAALSSGVQNYLAKMGIDDALFRAMVVIPSQEAKYISHDFAESTGLLGEDPAYEEWQRARATQVQGEERMHMMDRFHACQKEGNSMKECSKAFEG